MSLYKFDKIPLTSRLSADKMLHFMDRVEGFGCTPCPGSCEGTPVSYTIPGAQAPGGKKAQIVELTTGCGQETKYAVSLVAMAGHPANEPPAIACVNDDAMHLWPRFREV